MSFSVYVSVDGVTTNLSDGNPFRVESIEDLGGASVVRHQQHGPLQHGVSDLGYRLQPRTVVLNLLFTANNDATLDTYRSVLMSAFKPLTDISIFLYVERDDDTTRRLTCHTVDDIAIDLVPEHRPGHLHRATLHLRAADPLWLNTTVRQSSYSGSAADWWTAGGAIDSASVMEHVEYPAQGQAWTYMGTITGEYTVVFRSAQEPDSGTPTAFHVGTASITSSHTDLAFYRNPSNGFFGALSFGGESQMAAGTRNYMLVHSTDGADFHITYLDGTTFFSTNVTNVDVRTTARRWRSDSAGNASTYWTSEIPRAAVYNIELELSQRAALNTWMAGTAILGTISATNGGDAPEYPLITIRGPIADPILTNLATGDVLNLTGLELDSDETWTIDLRNGNKTVTDASSDNQMGSVLYFHTLMGWHLAPSPIATGGTNSIRVQAGGSISTNTRITIEHYDRYMSF